MFLELILVALIGWWLYDNYKFWTTVRPIPAPSSLPIIGNLFYLTSNPNKIFSNLRRLARDHYPIWRMSAFNYHVIGILDPCDIEMVISGTKHMSKSRIYKYFKNWLGTGLLTSTGSKWHKRRKILTPAFHFSILQEFISVFNDESEKLADKLLQECGRDSFDVVPVVTNFALHAIGETAMGFKNVDEGVLAEYKAAVYTFGHIMINRLGKPWMHVQNIFELTELGALEKTTVKTLRQFTNNIIHQRQVENLEKRNSEQAFKKRRLAMLDLLLAYKEEGTDIDIEGIREEVDTFMFEGHDTTSMAISMLLLTLANLPEIQAKIFEEIIEVVGPSKAPTYTELRSLKYTDRCIKETLRIFPSVPFISRYAGEDFTTKTGFTIPKNTVVHIHIFDIHRSPHLYSDPLKFDPDRFLPENVNKRHPFAYIPFSAGPRNCIGQKFALLELKAALCGILRKVALVKVDEMYDIKFKMDMVLRPSSAVRIKVVPRQSPNKMN